MMMGKQVRENAQQKLHPTSANNQLGPRSFASPEPEHEALGQEAWFGHSFGEIGLFPIQPKLVVGPPDDKYEREADQVAEQLMRMPETWPQCQVKSQEEKRLQNKTICSQISPLLQRAIDPAKEDTVPEYDMERPVQTKVIGGQVSSACLFKEDDIRALRNGGQTLSEPVRAFFEPRFGRDFSQVRVHADTRATEMAQMLNARAFTFGRDIVFGAKQYVPGTVTGQRLLAHELTHVIQQTGLSHPYQRINNLCQSQPLRRVVSLEPSLSDLETIHRVIWYPNTDTGRKSFPWGQGPYGDVLEALTDAGTSINIWRPDDGTTYWCHGYTFGGSTARGGPYSIWGQTVPTVLRDDGWKQVYSCLSRENDILVFYDQHGSIAHSGIVRSVSAPGARVDERRSTLQSKWGAGPLDTSSWLNNANIYGGYRCFSKAPAQGPCSGNGANEIV